jgi:hypothetical protein
MSPAFTRQQAADAVAKARGERDTIQANLFDLDGSFGKRLLEGAALTGTTRQRWDSAADSLAALWELFKAYSDVIDRAAGILARSPGQRDLAEISALLARPCIEFHRPAPLGRRDLADTGRERLTLTAAKAKMSATFTEVAALVSAAEEAWNDVAGRLDTAAADLDRVEPLGDDDLAAQISAVRAELDRLRGLLNTDPLGGQVDQAAVDRLRSRAGALVARSAELTWLRSDARQRIAAITATAAAARAAREGAAAACRRAATEITPVPAVPADRTDLSARVAALDTLLATGRWSRLSSELDLLDRELASAAGHYRDAEQAVAALLSRRHELRGLLGAYKAKAGRLGAAEDLHLTARYDRALELLSAAPCDLTAAEAAVHGYQQAVLAIGARRS